MATLLSLAIALAFLYACARVAARTGYSPWWALGLLVPFVNLALVFKFALVEEWPLERRLREAEARLTGAGRQE